MRISSLSSLVDAHLVLRCNATISDALHALEKNGQNFIIVVDQNNKLLGMVTDGDIRRAFLKKISLNQKITAIASTNPITLRDDQTDAEALHFCQIHSVKSIPIVSKKNRLQGVFINIPERISNPTSTALFVMAGGRGKRLYPLTRDCPKPLINVAGRPIIDYILDKAMLEGFSKVFISVNHLANKIEQHVTQARQSYQNVTFVREDKPLGTAGSLSLADFNGIENVIVVNADIITQLALNDLLKSHIKSNRMATMAVKSHIIQNPYGVVNIQEEQITSFDEKPVYSSLINIGVYALSTNAIKYLEKAVYCDMPNLFEKLIKQGENVGIFRFDDFWIDLGSPVDLEFAQNTLDTDA